MPASCFLQRPQPIRNAILAYLSEPRSAQAIARHINRPVPTATGHLAAMRRLGLVVRLGYAAYARADYAGPPCPSTGSPAAPSALACSWQPNSSTRMAHQLLLDPRRWRPA